MNTTDEQKILKAGKITGEVRAYAKTIVKKGVPLVEIAEKIEAKIISLGGRPAFPVNLSIDNIAAHYTPSHDDTTVASGLIKVDFGVHIDGWAADNSMSLDLDNSSENKKLIKASEDALEAALKIAKAGVAIGEIGKTIHATIDSHGFNPVMNLSGHSMEKYDLHAGTTIPNVDNHDSEKLKVGLYAIEPFATTGTGKVRDGKPSGIYAIVNEKNVRSPIARKVLNFVIDEYQTLPFCSRWIVKALGQTALFGLKELENVGILHQFAQLVEVSGAKVSQAEHTILVQKDKTIVTTA